MKKERYQQPNVKEEFLMKKLNLLETLSGEVYVDDYADGGELPTTDRIDFLGNN